MICYFEVRNDKSLGILIESFTTENDQYFFKHHEKPLHKHCQQVQRIVKEANVQRSRKIKIDISAYRYEYFPDSDNTASFKGTKLNSVKQQIEKVTKARINKEVGLIKRQQTIDAKKQTADQKNLNIVAMMKAADQKFQAERANRIDELLKGSSQPVSSRQLCKVMPSPRSDEQRQRSSHSGQQVSGSGQQTLGSNQQASGSGTHAIVSGEQTIGSGQPAIRSGQPAIRSGQQALGSGRLNVLQELSDYDDDFDMEHDYEVDDGFNMSDEDF